MSFTKRPGIGLLILGAIAIVVGVTTAVLGGFLPNGVLSGDGLNFLGKYPQVHMVESDRTAATIWEFLRDFYQGQNGRLSIALSVGLFWSLAHSIGFEAENFPVNFLRALTLVGGVVAVFMALNDVCKGVVRGFLIGNLSKLLVGLSILSLSTAYLLVPTIFDFSLFFSTYGFQYVLPLFFLSPFVYLRTPGFGKPSHSLGQRARASFFFVFGLLLLEQTLVVLPVLAVGAIATAFASFELSRKQAINNSLWVLALVLGAFAIYFLSPGQIYRMSVTAYSGEESNLLLLRHWFARDWGRGYQLFLGGFSFIPGRVWPFFHLGLIGVSAWVFTRSAQVADINDAPSVARCQRYGMLLTVALAYVTSLLTLLFSRYLPLWSQGLPVCLAVVNLLFAFWIVLVELRESAFFSAASQRAWLRVLWLAVALGLPFVVGARLVGEWGPRAWETLGWIDEQDQLRRELFEQVAARYRPDARNCFEIQGFPRNPYGWSLEPPWGFSAFIRWRFGREKKIYAFMLEDLPKRESVTDCVEWEVIRYRKRISGTEPK
jgi:hypothetical protein